MTSEQPDLHDTVRDYRQEYNMRNNTAYYRHELYIIACCPATQCDDYYILLQKQGQSTNPHLFWSIPEVDLDALPGSTTLDNSILDIVKEYCRQTFTPDLGFAEFLYSSKGGERNVSTGSANPSALETYVVVNLRKLPTLQAGKRDEFGLFELRSKHWFQFNEESLRKSLAEFELLESVVEKLDETRAA